MPTIIQTEERELGEAIAETAVQQALEGLRKAPAPLAIMLQQKLRDMASRGDATAAEVMRRFDANQ